MRRRRFRTLNDGDGSAAIDALAALWPIPQPTPDNLLLGACLRLAEPTRPALWRRQGHVRTQQRAHPTPTASRLSPGSSKTIGVKIELERPSALPLDDSAKTELQLCFRRGPAELLRHAISGCTEGDVVGRFPSSFRSLGPEGRSCVCNNSLFRRIGRYEALDTMRAARYPVR